MTDDVLTCPHCSHQLRIRDEWLGKRVGCPDCRNYFQAPARGTDGKLGPATKLPSVRNDNPLMIPGAMLFLVGLFSFFWNAVAWKTLNEMNDRERDEAIAFVEKLSGKKIETDEERRQLREDMEAQMAQGRRFIPWFVFGTLIECLAGMAIMALRFHRLAVLGSAIAIVNFGAGCCFASMPVGLWCVVLLMNGEVRQAFR